MFLDKKEVANSAVEFAGVLRYQFPVLLGATPDSNSQKIGLQRWIIALCIWTIAAVAAYDLFLTVKYAASLDIYEKNPAGRMIMQLNRGEVHSLEPVALFSSCKFFGTLIVLMVLQGLSRIRCDWALVVSLALASFQLVLLALFLL